MLIHILNVHAQLSRQWDKISMVSPELSYTLGCPPVREDNPPALTSGLSFVQMDKHDITIL